MPGIFVSYFRVIQVDIYMFLLHIRSNFTMLKSLYLCGFSRNLVKSRVCENTYKPVRVLLSAL